MNSESEKEQVVANQEIETVGENSRKKPKIRNVTAKVRKEFWKQHRMARYGDDHDSRKSEGSDSDRPKEKRLPKRKVAVLLGFCGTGYQGMQINPDAKTIEGDLFEAFCKVGAVSKDNAVDPKKVNLMRAARTDKGVHAAGQVISIKISIVDDVLFA